MGVDHVVRGEHVYDGKVFDRAFPKWALDKIKNEFIAADDDIIISTYPKSGTIWMQEILYLIHSNGDTETASKLMAHERVPFIEHCEHGKEFEDARHGLTMVQEKSSNRLIKTHLDPSFFSKTLNERKTKFIIQHRNVKDVLVSYYHFYIRLEGFGPFLGTWDEFFELIKARKLVHGDWFDYVSAWTEHKNNPNVHTLFYEDLVKDLKKEISKICNFLNKHLSDETIEKIINHVSIDNLKKNKMGGDLRKGGVGGWQNYFSKEQSDYIDKLYSESIVPIGLKFDFTI